MGTDPIIFCKVFISKFIRSKVAFEIEFNRTEIMNKKSSKEPELLNDYSRKKNKEGLFEVAEMLKHPVSLEQAKEQTRKFMEEEKTL